MVSKATSPEKYLEEIPEDRKEAFLRLRQCLIGNLPEGFEEVMCYGMISFVVPHQIYPPGYHCDPKLPLNFIAIASQKNFISLYHMGIYANPELMDWFVSEYPNHTDAKLDMGKSCIRFKNMNKIPFKLIDELASKMTCQDWIKLYESKFIK